MEIDVRYILKGVGTDFLVGILIGGLGGLLTPDPIPILRTNFSEFFLIPPTIVEDLFWFVFLTIFLMTIILTYIVRFEMLIGRINPPEWYRHQIPLLRNLPDNLLVRALLMAVVGIFLFMPITYMMFGALQITSIPHWNYIVFRGLYGALVLPIIGVIVRLSALGGD